MKSCSRCNETKPLTEFSIESRAKDGHSYHCKDCAKKYRIEWESKKDKGKIKEKSAEYREKNRETIRENSRRFRTKYKNDTFCYKCTVCHKEFILKHEHNKQEQCCSIKCWNVLKGTRIQTKCAECELEITIPLRRYKEYTKHFCSSSCCGKFSTANKINGIKRSKFEVFLETEIRKTFPNLLTLPSDRTAIHSELDFYFPTINLGIEINGIFHYEPIFGKETLDRIQNNDNRKMQACLEKGIELIIIDSSSMTSRLDKKMKLLIKDILDIITSKALKETNAI